MNVVITGEEFNETFFFWFFLQLFCVTHPKKKKKNSKESITKLSRILRFSLFLFSLFKEIIDLDRIY